MARIVIAGDRFTQYSAAVDAMLALAPDAYSVLVHRHQVAVAEADHVIASLLEPVVEQARLARERTAGGLSMAEDAAGAVSIASHGGLTPAVDGHDGSGRPSPQAKPQGPEQTMPAKSSQNS